MEFNSHQLFKDFILNHSPSQVARHLRSALLDFISHNIDTGMPVDFDEYISEFYDLFQILDAATDEH